VVAIRPLILRLETTLRPGELLTLLLRVLHPAGVRRDLALLRW
jgi:hypothetical protein